MEGNPFHNLMDCVRDLRQRGLPAHQVTFVPDAEGQFTSDHGWTFPQDAARLKPLIDDAHALGLRVSLFMDADPVAMLAAKAVGADRVELYTEPFAANFSRGEATSAQNYREAAIAAEVVGLGINAGHDLNLGNLGAFLAQVPNVLEVSIGHALIADALEFGLHETVRKYLTLCNQA